MFNSAMLLVIKSNYFILQLYSNEESSYEWSIPGHRVIDSDRDTAHNALFTDCFAENPRFSEEIFCWRCWMGRNLFLRISNEVCAYDNTFLPAKSVVGRLGLSDLQKITATSEC